ncbi:MAG: hypothetical protein ACI8QZ_003577 [Chlamydiales bacterium]|jgi:hypothetical protein
MLNAEELKASLAEEIRIIRHLGTKVDPEQLDWRPTAGQRSTIELMRYLTQCGIVPVRAMLAGDWSGAGKTPTEIAEMTLDGFDAAMERQQSELNAALDELGDAQLMEREGKLPWGDSLPLSQAILMTSVRFLCAYRQQLFLHAKQSGSPGLNTSNAWRGMDSPA